MNKREFMKALDSLSPAVQQAFIASVQKFATSVPLDRLEAAIAANDNGALFDLLSYDRGDFSIFDRALADAMAQGGDATAAYFAGMAKAQGANVVKVAFDATAPEATAWLRERSSTLIAEIVEQQREAVRNLLTAATEQGRGVRAVARDIVGTLNRATGRREGGVLGLTQAQAGYADNALTELLSGDAGALRNYLDRQLRDRRFDAAVHRAIKDGKPVLMGQAEKMVRFYRSALLKKRGEAVARTEVIAALNEGRAELRQQLVDDGIVRAQDVLLEWDAANDMDTRPSHAAMDGQTRPMGQPFVSGDGNLLMYPGDRSRGAPASDVINCFAPWTRIGLVGLEGAVASAYCGDLIEIVVGGGVNLAVTPNHPVLTDRGWVPAGEVVEGDQLLQSLRADLGSAATEPHVGDWYASAEQTYEAAKRLGRVQRASRSVVNLHGHVPSHDVDVVALPRKLRGALDALTGEVIGDIGFSETDVSERGASLFSGLTLARSSPASGPDSSVRRFRSGVAHLFRHHRRRPSVAFGNSGSLKTHIGKAGVDETPANAKGICNAENRFTGFKQPLDVWRNFFAPLSEHFGAFARSALRVITTGVRRQSEVFMARLHDGRANAYFASHICDQSAFAMQPADGFKVFGASGGEPFRSGAGSANMDASLFENAIDGRVFRPLTSGNICGGDSGVVEGDNTGVPLFAGVRVKAVSRRHYDGPVYDFQTSTGILLAEGIIVHNCRCYIRERIDFMAAAAVGLG